MARETSEDSFAEKDFYLEEFRGKTLLFAVGADEFSGLGAVSGVLDELLRNGSRVLLFGAAPDPDAAVAGAEGLGTRLWSAAPRTALPLVRFPSSVAAVDDRLLGRVWTALRDHAFCVCLPGPHWEGGLVEWARFLGARLRVYKIVLVDDGAAAAMVVGGQRRVSFLNGAVLAELLRGGEAEWVGLGSLRPMLEAVGGALAGGVASVSLCHLSGLRNELFTYEGCGTLFTLSDYCEVDRLGIDDFDEVERLLRRGEREGYLRPRTEEEMGTALLSGYGARLGPRGGHLAGVVSLQLYPEARAGEIVCLYTITRFKGEGVGTRLVAKVAEEGRRLGLRFLFACTTREEAGRLFERQGFRQVAAEEVPYEKWREYDQGRKEKLAVYKLVLSGAS